MAFKNTPIPKVAAVVLALLEFLDTCERQSDLGRWANSVLSHALRQLECFVEPEVSVAAAEIANQLGHGDLRSKRYGFQDTNEDNDPIFHWEHVRPVSDMKSRLLAMSRPRSLESIEQVLRTTDVAWVLKEEDRKLTEQKYRTQRPEDAWVAYEACGIRIVGRGSEA